MKKLLSFFLLLAATLGAQSETIDLGSRGRLTLFILGDWKIETSNIANQYTINLTPVNEEVNASATLEITFPETDRYDTKPRLKLRVEADAEVFSSQSVEGRAVAREFTFASLRNSYGFYCNFTDHTLRGKPPQKGNYKVISVGKIRLAPEVLIDVGINADGFRDEPYQQLLGAIEGMEYARR